ncbi:hypothetical protein NDI44_08285 [Trichocoleus sp. DQ-A3]|uniref:hypothetical protein n=1 Tax=Cyanophyceae TaxID=3028117 RepID=UPI0016862CF7|nr:hypothetical protein [Coleofasciculus sp. FACHB-125]MBD1899189.1 hypothetical protein [Coleofasciculus sp. FACHB-125]
MRNFPYRASVYKERSRLVRKGDRGFDSLLGMTWKRIKTFLQFQGNLPCHGSPSPYQVKKNHPFRLAIAFFNGR